MAAVQQHIRERVANQLVTVCFDAGMSLVTRTHVLVVTVVVEKAAFYLRPQHLADGETFDTAKLAQCVQRALDGVGLRIEDVRMWVVDGALTNTCAIECFSALRQVTRGVVDA